MKPKFFNKLHWGAPTGFYLEAEGDGFFGPYDSADTATESLYKDDIPWDSRAFVLSTVTFHRARKFLYFEAGYNTASSIESPENFNILYGWMSDMCKEDDQKLVEWAETAEVGDYFHHRLGTCVRVKI